MFGDIDVQSYHSIWWRRVRTPWPLDDLENKEERDFSSKEAKEAFAGAIMASGLKIYNHPGREFLAENKPYQLSVAQQCGLTLPETLITTNPQKAREFVHFHKDVIYKTFGPNDIHIHETRKFKTSDFEALDQIRFSPLTLQTYIPLGMDIRATVIKNEIFCAEIITKKSHSETDWRNDMDYTARPHILPDEIGKKLLILVNRLGLDSGSADFRISPDGVYYFLEINCSGQFLFLDLRADIDTANPFCNMLISDY